MTTTQTFNENRQFGVEIEFVADAHQLSQLLIKARAAGLAIEQEGYNHNTRNHWKIVSDASCGWELVSPILKGRQGLEDLEKACQALNAVGVQVNKSCGLHVHHDTNGMNVNQLKNIFIIYAKLEKTFDSLVPASRRDNRYCRSLIASDYTNRTVEQYIERISSLKNVSQMESFLSDRYRKVNFQSYLKYGTVEFRQHAGTTDFTKMYNWILLTQQVVERANGSIQTTYNAAYDNLQGLRNTLRLIEAKGASEEIANMFKWMRERAKQFA